MQCQGKVGGYIKVKLQRSQVSKSEKRKSFSMIHADSYYILAVKRKKTALICVCKGISNYYVF